VEECWKILKESCVNAITKFVPVRVVRKEYKEWISRETMKSMQKRNRWFKQWKKSNTAGDCAKYHKFRKETKRRLSLDKRKWVEAEFHEKDVIKFWKSVRKLTKGQRSSSEVPELTEGSTVATTHEEKAEMLRKQYKRPWSNIQNHQQPIKESGALETAECPEKWVYTQLKKLVINKAAGPDGIPQDS
jgi:hypothetical protein